MAARNLEEKMDEKSDNVDIWINLFEIKLPLIQIYKILNPIVLSPFFIIIVILI